MDKTTIAALLGRPLTSNEDANFETYLDISISTLELMTCLDLSDCEDTRVYDTREGYRTLFTDLFTDVNEVKINGKEVDEDTYSKRQWDKRRGKWYNSLVFNCKFNNRQTEVEVSADWVCSKKLPNDLKAVIAGLFGLIGQKQKYDPTMQSKQVEDFRITLRADADLDADFQRKYGVTLAGYSQCNIPNVQHGEVC